MASLKGDNKHVELVFPRPKRGMDVYLPKVKGEEFFELFSTDVNAVAEWFSQFKIDSMELKIDGVINSPETTRLLIGLNEDSGMRVVLKPKSSTGSHEIHQDSKERV
jgi:hypothetical protein